jgi:hypothetical protein
MPDVYTLLRSVDVALPSLAGEIDKRWSNARDGQAEGLLIFANTRSGREVRKIFLTRPASARRLEACATDSLHQNELALRGVFDD